jgi:hypothetical protein
VTNTDKLLMYVMEICRRDQVESLLEISQAKGRPLAEMALETVRVMLDSLPWEERQEVIAQFKKEDGIDLEELLS